VECTHIVLWIRDLSRTHSFYIGLLGCTERRYAPDEGFLSIGVGPFIMNFYAEEKPLPPGYTAGIAHLGFELETRREVEDFFARTTKSDLCNVTSTEEATKKSHMSGPYRFHVQDPDGYIIEIGTWEGVEE
jgi:catechol 2,3-dioxygenase-like lactoylglutathione lyase family enzyme